MESTILPVIAFGSTKPSSSSSSLPSWAAEHDSPSAPNLKSIAQSVIRAKRVAVVCGAGISCASGIPDFRGANGLFDNLKKQHPSANISSGKDLFDASLFSSEANAAIFYTMIAELKTMADEAQPTPFHRFLKSLDDEGKLFRVYTQNIDGLEEKVGLSYGLGDPTKLSKKRKSPSKPAAAQRASPFDRRSPPPSQPSFLPIPSSSSASSSSASSSSTARIANDVISLRLTRQQSRSISPPTTTSSVPSSSAMSTSASFASTATSSITPPPSSSSSATAAANVPMDGIPRCIPLHGTLSTLYCPHCSRTVPLAPYIPILASGTTLPCPSCEETESLRIAIGERSRGVGRLKPDVVLYGETHKEGERIGEITRKDLMGARPDLLIVVGTSLKVPGTKKLVRELSKVIRPPPAASSLRKNVEGEMDVDGDEQEQEQGLEEEEDDDGMSLPAASGSTIASTSTSRTRLSSCSPLKKGATMLKTTTTTKKKKEEKRDPVHVIFLNAEFPSSASEWRNVFDVWCRGDVQEFVDILLLEKEEEALRVAKKKAERELARERKEERDRVKALQLLVLKEADVRIDVKVKVKVELIVVVDGKGKGKAKGKGKGAEGNVQSRLSNHFPSTSSRPLPSAISSSSSSTSIKLKSTSSSIAMGKSKSTGGAGSLRPSLSKKVQEKEMDRAMAGGGGRSSRSRSSSDTEEKKKRSTSAPLLTTSFGATKSAATTVKKK